MSCPRLSPQYEENIFDEGWTKASIEPPDLNAISDFNSCFDIDESNNARSIDPKLTLSNHGSPVNSYSSLSTPFQANGLEQTLSPEPDFNHLDSGMQPPGPYYHSPNLGSVLSYPSPLRHQYPNVHRRSISQPPESMLHHSNQAPVVFHRAGHCLGKPTSSHPYPQALKSVPSSTNRREQRHAPYPPATRSGQSRYQLRKSQTQCGRAPTSTPLERVPNPAFLGLSAQQLPAPEATMTIASSPVPMAMDDIDPLLVSTPVACTSMKTLAIPMTVEQLREIIRETVQAAVNGLKIAQVTSMGNNDVSEVAAESDVEVHDSEKRASEAALDSLTSCRPGAPHPFTPLTSPRSSNLLAELPMLKPLSPDESSSIAANDGRLRCRRLDHPTDAPTCTGRGNNDIRNSGNDAATSHDANSHHGHLEIGSSTV